MGRHKIILVAVVLFVAVLLSVAAYSARQRDSAPSPEDVVALLRDAPLAMDADGVNASTLARLADAEPDVATENVRYVATRGHFSYFVGTNSSDDQVCLLILHTDGSGATGCAGVDGLLRHGRDLSLITPVEQTTAVVVGDAFSSAPEILKLGEAHSNLVIVDDLSEDVAVEVAQEEGPPLVLKLRAPGPIP